MLILTVLIVIGIFMYF